MHPPRNRIFKSSLWGHGRRKGGLKLAQNDVRSQAFKHLSRDISELGLDICKDILANIQHSELAPEFYSHYFLRLLQVSTSILGRHTAPFPPFLIQYRVPRGFAQDPSTDRAHLRRTSSP